MLTTRARASKIAWSLAIVVAAAAAGIEVDWQAPGIGRYTRDWLVRARETDAGATAYIGKHAVPQEVIERVREALSRHADVDRRFRTAGPVRGLLGNVAPNRMLRLACANRPDARSSAISASSSPAVVTRR